MRKISPTLLMLLFVALVACGESYFAPSSPEAPEATIVTLPPATPEATTPTVAPADPSIDVVTECDVIQLVRASIKSETDCKKGARFYLEAPGATYFNIHLGGLNNGPILGPNTPGQWSEWYALEKGSYTYTAAAETKVDGSVIQCDHHNKTFTVPDCPCVKPPAPPCQFGPAIYDPRDCTFQCPPCDMPDQPKCPYGPAIMDGCGWKCPPCVLPDPPPCRYGPAIPDKEACEWNCPPCVLPTPPDCPFGPAIPDRISCSWSCPPCEVICPEGEHLHPETCDCWCNPVGKPECVEQTWNEVTCSWEGDCPCEYSISHPKVGKVFCHNLVAQKMECSHFAPGTAQVGYTGGSTPFASMNADVVILKKGGGKVCGTKKRYIVYENVTAGDPLKAGWSHTTYCNCKKEM